MPLTWLGPLVLCLSCSFCFDLDVEFSLLDWMYFSRLHAWGDTLEEAFEQCAMAMFGYMTDTGTVEPLQTVEVETQGNFFSAKGGAGTPVCSECIFPKTMAKSMMSLFSLFQLAYEIRYTLKFKPVVREQNYWTASNHGSLCSCVGDDLQSLLFHFLDEWLYKFSADTFFIPRVSKVFSFFTEQMGSLCFIVKCLTWNRTQAVEQPCKFVQWFWFVETVTVVWP